MRAKFITSIFVLSVLFLGCSKDDINDTPETDNITFNQVENKGGIMALPEVHFNEIGDFEVMQSELCGKSGMIHSIGFIDAGKDVKFLTEYYNCTNGKNDNSIEAVWADMEGDQLFLVSTKEGVDNNYNLEYQLQVNGGTGKYESATGQLTVTNVKTYETKDAGFYQNTAKGSLIY